MKTISHLIDAQRAGKLPEGSRLVVDNDCAFLRDSNGDTIAHFDEGPEVLFIEVLNKIGIKAVSV